MSQIRWYTRGIGPKQSVQQNYGFVLLSSDRALPLLLTTNKSVSRKPAMDNHKTNTLIQQIVIIY